MGLCLGLVLAWECNLLCICAPLVEFPTFSHPRNHRNKQSTSVSQLKWVHGPTSPSSPPPPITFQLFLSIIASSISVWSNCSSVDKVVFLCVYMNWILHRRARVGGMSTRQREPPAVLWAGSLCCPGPGRCTAPWPDESLPMLPDQTLSTPQGSAQFLGPACHDRALFWAASAACRVCWQPAPCFLLLPSSALFLTAFFQVDCPPSW